MSRAPSMSLTNGGKSFWQDWLGITASVGCAIHCAAMPFVIAYLPIFGMEFMADESFHQWMALACFLIAISAFIPGLRKHGNWWPAGIGMVGLSVITFAAFGMEDPCCPTCASADTEAVAGVDIGCDDAGCAHCSECEACESNSTGETDGALAASQTLVSNSDEEVLEGESALAPGESENQGFWARVAPFVTPLGGIILVIAHLLNRRFGNCCNECHCAPKDSEVSLIT